MIKAPFNFVPLPEEVFIPEWWSQVSQDIPFSDGVSGSIDIQLRAETPIFVRNGHKRDDAPQTTGSTGNDTYKSFSKTNDGHYFIPGTSIKGAMRSVMEIMSFAKMSFTENQSFGLRNLNNESYRNKVKGVHCGWMTLKTEGAEIEDWGEPGRISVELIDKQYKTKFMDFVLKELDTKDDADKTGKKKYEMFGDASRLKNFFTFDKDFTDSMRKKNKVDPRMFYKFGGDQKGFLVFTGQSDKRKPKHEEFDRKKGKNVMKKATGKYYEFVFLEPKQKNTLVVSKELFKAFEFIHKTSPDYVDLWRERLYKGERIPVFFKLESDNQTIHSIGLSYMYKYPYEKKVYDAMPEVCRPNNVEIGHDLVEGLLGYAQNKENLKGRVLFGHAMVQGNPMAQEQSFVSSSPHASFYPLYVKEGKDWDRALRINGRKRYPSREEILKFEDAGTKNMTQNAYLLKQGATFNEKIVFHNLKPEELGALLSALTFHGNNDKCFHNLGFGKPMGYGKTKVTIKELKIDYQNVDWFPYMESFEKCMENFMQKAHLGTEWLSSPQIQELLLMAQGIKRNQNSDYSYMKLSLNKEENEFLTAKEFGEHLLSFSRQNGTTFIASSVAGRKAEIKEETVKEVKPVVIVPTKRKQNDVVPAIYIGDKKVRIDGEDYDIQLVISKFDQRTYTVNQCFGVVISQISKAGKITQVKRVD